MVTSPAWLLHMVTGYKTGHNWFWLGPVTNQFVTGF